MSDTSIEDLHEYVGYRGKCTKPVKAKTRRRHDPWYDRTAVRGRYSHDEQRRRAARACRGCPVQSECLLVALALEAESGMHWGYWGATIPADRARMLAERGGQVDVVVEEDGDDDDEGVVELDMAS